jgi:hypothetical protein
VTHKKIQNGHQFKGYVIRIDGIEARHPAQSIVDILGRPNWWCNVGHCIAVLEIFVPPESVCVESVLPLCGEKNVFSGFLAGLRLVLIVMRWSKYIENAKFCAESNGGGAIY